MSYLEVSKVMRKIKYLFITLVVTLLTTLVITRSSVYAKNSIDSDGIYTTTYSISGQSGMGASMIKKYLKSEAKIENINSNYYLSITSLSSSIEDLNIHKDEEFEVGRSISKDDDANDVYTFTLTYEDLESDLNFSVYVSIRKETYTFSLKLDLENVNLISSEVDTKTDRLALYVPTLKGDYSDSYEVVSGVTFNIPDCKAYFGSREIDVIYTLYYNDTLVDIIDSKAELLNIGVYTLYIKASDPSYKTLLGYDTYVSKTITITTSASGSSIAKIKSENLTDVYLIASKLTTDSNTYNIVKDKLKKISENYEVFEISIIDRSGSEVALDDGVIVGIKVDDTFDRTKIKVYYLDDSLNLLTASSKNGGRFVDVSVSNSGIYILYVPGVTFVMPIWGYILICVGAFVLILLAILLIVILIRKHKHKNKTDEDENPTSIMARDIEFSKKEYKHWRDEVRLIPKMIRIYCKGKHKTKDGLCAECKELNEYALFRLSKCPFKVNKGFCSFCKIHCYKPDMRVKIKDVMKYSGPRMLFTHPIFSISHVVQMIKYKKSIKKNVKEDLKK